ncbi:NIPSNAP family protein [Nocardia sp. NPDC088792]|uniref:NIPSNAP family protein n=1 Tax=Nocardia sp. NPDC088792 TaxID=3364332 RepID=UPI00382F2D77
MSEIQWPVVELRQYTLRPGSRDTLIELFDRELVETQEAVGMRIVGQFRDEDDPDRFVWIRAFRDMPSRLSALTGFYLESDAWRTHAPAARATMVDTDNALLLRPVGGTGELAAGAVRPAVGAGELPASRVLGTIYQPAVPLDEFTEFFESTIRPTLADAGIFPIGCYETSSAANDFPALPVREDEQVFAWFAVVDRSLVWTEDIGPELSKRLAAPTVHLRLAPTARSLLR